MSAGVGCEHEAVSESDLLVLPDVVARGSVGDRPAIPLAPDGLGLYTRRDLRQEEIAIAREFHGGPMWFYAAAAFGCFAVWLSFFPLCYQLD